jgi:hypothetical protein
MSFPSNTSIWNILKSVESEKKIALITASSSKKLKKGEVINFYNQPVVNFLSTEITTNTDLRKTTLSSLGVKSGSAVLRVRFKATEVPVKEFLAQDEILAGQEAEEAKLVEQKISDNKVATQLRIQEETARRAEEAEQAKINEEIRAQEARRAVEERQAQEQEKFERDFAEAQRQSLAMNPSSSHTPISTATASSSSHQEGQSATSSMDVDATHSPTPPQRKKFEVVVEPPGPPGLLKTLLEGGMIDEDYSRLHEALRMRPDEVAKANEIPSTPCDRTPVVLAPSSAPFDPSSIKIPEDFFEVSAEDLSKGKSANKNQQGEVMKTKAMKEKERLQRLARFKKCFIRFRFPDRVELQAAFYPQEGLEHLVAFVRENLADPNLDFYLFTTPPTTHVHPTKNLRDQGFLPAALVQIGLGQNAKTVSPFLKPEVMALIQEKTYVPIVQEYKHASDLKIVTGAEVSASSTAAKASSSSSSSTMDVDEDHGAHKDAKTSSSDKKEKKVPKWFTMGKKK